MTDVPQTLLHVRGMTCGNCVRHVEQAARSVPGVIAVSVDLAAGTVRVSHGPTTSVDQVVAAIEDAGYATSAPA